MGMIHSLTELPELVKAADVVSLLSSRQRMGCRKPGFGEAYYLAVACHNAALLSVKLARTGPRNRVNWALRSAMHCG